MRHRLRAAVLAIATSLAACSKSAEDCHYTASCDTVEEGSDSGALCNPTCNGTTPICDEATAKCVECVKNFDCPQSRPYCDTGVGECIQCRANAECTSASASVCIAGTCT